MAITEERTRAQIREDLDLAMTEGELEKRLDQLVMAHILAEGSTRFRYRGLGDRIFAMVFRRIYGEEIERVRLGEIERDFKRELAAAKGRISVHKGAAAGEMTSNDVGSKPNEVERRSSSRSTAS